MHRFKFIAKTGWLFKIHVLISPMQPFLQDNTALIQQVAYTLQAQNSREVGFALKAVNFSTASSVLFLLGRHPHSSHPCLILTKRSSKVRQSGDLCCPGGSITPRRDLVLSNLLKLPFSPLARWPHWKSWRRRNAQAARTLAILLATGLRESFEEMRLNPLRVKLLGLLPSQSLIMFDRVIYPLVAWVHRQQRFYPNWEVEKIVYIPLQELLKSENYARYRLDSGSAANGNQTLHATDFPCFRHTNRDETEVLWGATYQITSTFLKSIFDFSAPDWTSLPVVNGTLDDNYLTGER